VTDLRNTSRLMTTTTTQFLKQQIAAFNLEKKNLELHMITHTNLFFYQEVMLICIDPSLNTTLAYVLS